MLCNTDWTREVNTRQQSNTVTVPLQRVKYYVVANPCYPIDNKR